LSLLEAVVLGIVQGLTEFLPISSSGHLVLGEFLLKVKLDDLSFEVFVHFGTFLSVVIVFRRAIWSVLEAVWVRIGSVFTGESSSAGREDWRTFWLLVVASVPAGLAGLMFKSHIQKSFSSATFAAAMLLVTSVVLFLTPFFRGAKDRLGFGDAIAIGLAQALAMLPGISRSGMTISAGIFKGVKPSRAAEFSFLLSLPAILGASLLEMTEMAGNPQPAQNLSVYLVGAATAFLTGYLAIRLLLDMIKKGRFQYFAYYCFAVGLLFLVLTR
jgi:undecaprenyl-diphosphatase